jgi:outer membrane immunogenic protein
MKKYLLSSVALTTVFGGSAMAADMPLKAPPLPTCYACNWTGFYIGVNAGGSIGHDGSQDTISLNPAGSPNGLGGVPPGVLNPISNATYNSSPAGPMGGFQAGFNWQTGHAVLGVEVDWDAVNQRNTLQINNFLASSTTVAPAAYTMTDEQKIGWLATARARLGAAYGYTLWYVTGGAAWGGIKNTSTFQGTGSNLFATAPAAAFFEQTKGGFAIGGGIETALAWMGAANWSAKLEYLYVDLGTVTNGFVVPLTATPTSAYTLSSSSRINDHIVRAGLNYRFGGDRMAQGPSTPGPCPTCSWTGFYIGANAGGSIGRDRAHETDSINPAGVAGGVVAPGVNNPLTDVFHTDSPVGGMAGGQIGFNWQTSHVVLGAEADWDWVGQRDTFAYQNFVASTVNVAPTVISLTDEQKIKSLGTARARLGWADNCFLWYVTGGGAWGQVQSNYTFQSTQITGPATFGTAPFAASVSTTKTGWTIGGGVETSLAWLGLSDHWSGKLEYLYVDLGSITNSFTIPVVGAAGAHTYTSTSNLSDNIVRVGLNYRFGG